MNRTLSSILMLIASGATISCAQADAPRRVTKMPKPELEQVNPADFSYAKVYDEVVGILSGPEKCSDCKKMSGTFMVSYERHYGYSLNREHDLQESITPVFIDRDIKEKFDNFFSQENLARNVGKRIYCECTGDSLDRYGSVFYRIREARLYAR